jgi:hypothetical protein
MAASPSVSSGVTFARCLAVSMLVAGALGAGPTAAQSPSPEPTCIDRVGGVEPPPFATGPGLQAGEGGQGAQAGYQPLESPQLCPDGQVPSVTPFLPPEGKGNPLLGSAPSPAPRPAVAQSTPLATTLTSTCRGVLQGGSCYFYGNAAFRREADGGGMITRIERPTYVSHGSGHSLNELAVQGGHPRWSGAEAASPSRPGLRHIRAPTRRAMSEMTRELEAVLGG